MEKTQTTARLLVERKMSILHHNIDDQLPIFDKEQAKIKERSSLSHLLRKVFFFAVYYGILFG